MLLVIFFENIDTTILVFATKFFAIALCLDMMQKLVRWARLESSALKRAFLYHQVMQMVLSLFKFKYHPTVLYFTFEFQLVLNIN